MSVRPSLGNKLTIADENAVSDSEGYNRNLFKLAIEVAGRARRLPLRATFGVTFKEVHAAYINATALPASGSKASGEHGQAGIKWMRTSSHRKDHGSAD